MAQDVAINENGYYVDRFYCVQDTVSGSVLFSVKKS